MIILVELLKKHKIENVPAKHQYNLNVLLDRLNMIRAKRGLPMFITSGYRNRDDAIRIYKQLAKQRGITFNEDQIPWGSCHFIGAAADVSDKDGSLYQWCLENESFLAEIGLWMELKDDQPRVHFQIFPPRSNKRFFLAG